MHFCQILSYIVAFTTSLTASVPAPQEDYSPPQPHPDLGHDKLLQLQHMFWDRWIYPNNVIEAESINSTIFSEDVQGRVSDTRNFVGRELNTEYIFGLFIPSNDSFSVIGRSVDYKIIAFTGTGNIASASTLVNLTFASFENQTFPVRIDTWFTWNEHDQITQYDVIFRWFGYLLQTLVVSGPGTIEENMKAKVIGMASSICRSHAKYCTAPGNVQYESNEACFKFLTQGIRVGQSFELGMNTLLCRNVHEVMLKYRPDVHCSHVGISGGGMCDDTVSYREKASEQFFTNDPWMVDGAY